MVYVDSYPSYRTFFSIIDNLFVPLISCFDFLIFIILPLGYVPFLSNNLSPFLISEKYVFYFLKAFSMFLLTSLNTSSLVLENNYIGLYFVVV